MRLALVVVLVCACAALAARADAAPTRSTSCVAIVVWRGAQYVGPRTARDLPHGREVRAVEPGCNDVPGQPREPARRVRMRTIRGVPSRLALLRVFPLRVVYVANGYLLGRRLHRLLFGRVAAEGCTTGRAYPLAGAVVQPPSSGTFTIRRGRHEQIVVTDSRTRLGFPPTRRIRRGDRLRVRASPCRGFRVVAVRLDRD